MACLIKKSIKDPLIRQNVSWEVRWKSDDFGLITCWEQGRLLAQNNPSISQKARNNELPILPWKGGYSIKIQKGKCVPYYYLAMLQGLQGKDLNINLQKEIKLTCAQTGMTTIFTTDTNLHTND